MISLYKYSEKEIKQILDTMTVLVDTREQENQHILNYLDNKGIRHLREKVDTGDYMAIIPKNEELGLHRDLYLPVAIERKNSIDELASSIKDRTRFENELIRSKSLLFLLLVEDSQGYDNFVRGKYRSQYDPKALLGSLKTFEARYAFTTVFIDKS